MEKTESINTKYGMWPGGKIQLLLYMSLIGKKNMAITHQNIFDMGRSLKVNGDERTPWPSINKIAVYIHYETGKLPEQAFILQPIWGTENKTCLYLKDHNLEFGVHILGANKILRYMLVAQ